MTLKTKVNIKGMLDPGGGYTTFYLRTIEDDYSQVVYCPRAATDQSNLTKSGNQ